MEKRSRKIPMSENIGPKMPSKAARPCEPPALVLTGPRATPAIINTRQATANAIILIPIPLTSAETFPTSRMGVLQ